LPATSQPKPVTTRGKRGPTPGTDTPISVREYSPQEYASRADVITETGIVADTPPQPGKERKFIRNLRNIQASVSLEPKNPSLRIELKPRGQRGDIIPLREAYLESPLFEANHNLVFEIINEEQAREALAKQMVNAANEPFVHPALEAMRDENDQPILRHRILPPQRSSGQVMQERDASGRWVENKREVLNPPHYPTLGSTDNPMQPQQGAVRQTEISAYRDNIQR
jgi:hypothetical protein